MKLTFVPTCVREIISQWDSFRVCYIKFKSLFCYYYLVYLFSYPHAPSPPPPSHTCPTDFLLPSRATSIHLFCTKIKSSISFRHQWCHANSGRLAPSRFIVVYSGSLTYLRGTVCRSQEGILHSNGEGGFCLSFGTQWNDGKTCLDALQAEGGARP